jgi:YD repeat-containing protein
MLRFHTRQIFSTLFRAALIVSAVLTLPFAIDAASAANGSVTYTYDALGRVLTASYDTNVIVIYTYDANGNRTQQVINVNTAKLCWDTTGCTAGSTTNLWDTGLWN